MMKRFLFAALSMVFLTVGFSQVQEDDVGKDIKFEFIQNVDQDVSIDSIENYVQFVTLEFVYDSPKSIVIDENINLTPAIYFDNAMKPPLITPAIWYGETPGISTTVLTLYRSSKCEKPEPNLFKRNKAYKFKDDIVLQI